MKEQRLLESIEINNLIKDMANKYGYNAKTIREFSCGIITEIENVYIQFLISEDYIRISYGPIDNRKILYIREDKLNKEDIYYYVRFICLQIGIFSVEDMIG